MAEYNHGTSLEERMPRAQNSETVTGRDLHDRVVALIRDNPGMSQRQAFATLAERGEAGGKTPANIAAAFYRIQRQSGGGTGPRAASGNGGQRSTRARGRRRSTDRARSAGQVVEMEAMLDRIERDVRDALSTLADARAGLAEARASQEAIERVRRALAGAAA